MSIVFVGYDTAQDLAYNVCKTSIEHHSNIKIVPIVKSCIPGWTKEDGSTEFSFTRFLVPYFMHYRGWALFIDSDVVLEDDISKIFEYANERFAVQVVKHQYNPTNDIKMVDKPQMNYPKKNWSSVILFNCGHIKNIALTFPAVNGRPPKWLHQFEWLDDEDIGELPEEWNYLVGHSKCENPKLIHYTEGGPWLGYPEEDHYWKKYLNIYEKSVKK